MNDKHIFIKDSLGAHIHDLDEVTKHVSQKYFEKTAVLERGVTLGILDFRAAKRSVLMINGSHKRKIAEKILADRVGGGFDNPPTSHTTVRTVRYTAVQST